jgi:glycolate oxidase FAD binding subunit
LKPASVQEAAALLRECERPVRPVGGGTKPWIVARAEEPLETGGLNRILEHNVGDFTAILEAGVPFADAQKTFREHGQALAWDPPLSRPEASPSQPTSSALAGGATIGGIVATADSGPLRHRYGGVRDLVVGITVVLSDGTVAKAGGKVIKNVAGYDLAKLFAGSCGTLGLIATVSVRLHPDPDQTATVLGYSENPHALQRAVLELGRKPLEADSLDVAWEDGTGRVLVRFGGNTAAERARETAAVMEGLEGVKWTEDDGAMWAKQRSLQRSDGVVLKVSGRPTDLAGLLRVAERTGATVVSRGVLGLSWLAFTGDGLADRVAVARQELAPRVTTVLDGAERVADPWPSDVPGQAVMERLKARFDPSRIFRPGAFVGGI